VLRLVRARPSTAPEATILDRLLKCRCASPVIQPMMSWSLCDRGTSRGFAHAKSPRSRSEGLLLWLVQGAPPETILNCANLSTLGLSDFRSFEKQLKRSRAAGGRVHGRTLHRASSSFSQFGVGLGRRLITTFLNRDSTPLYAKQASGMRRRLRGRSLKWLTTFRSTAQMRQTM
jgi:hypothetical protein